MSLLKPRTIRGQLIAGLTLLEGLLFVVFSALTIQEHHADVKQRADRRVEYQVSMFASQAGYALGDHRPDRLARTLAVMRNSPTILDAMVTDPQGRTIAGTGGAINLTAVELSELPKLSKATIFDGGPGQREAAGPVILDGRLIGYVWIRPNSMPDRKDLRALLLLNVFYALAAIGGCTLLATFLARSMTRPLKVILDSTRHLVRYPEDTSSFPLALSTTNEAADLAAGLNSMVASIVEQRGGLNDTLALLDSMLANAPIGFAFFDHHYKLVRINQFLADLNHMPISLHLGRTVAEVLPAGIAETMQKSMEKVFQSGEPVRDLDLNAELDPRVKLEGKQTTQAALKRSWLVNLYPVKTGTQTVRWVGAIIVDTTERKRSEEALRKTEKLAAAGRLAASIAHEINNPLEAVTNLLYLLRHHTTLDPDALAYAELAQHEVARVSEITQQTLRFYRQSTLPLVSSVTDLLDSVVALHQGRVNSLQVEVVRHYGKDVDLFCFAGELRQLFANLVGNALDAMSQGGGRLTLKVRRSRSWRDPSINGIRVCVADTGMGMEEPVRQRIFEPFFTTKEVTGTGLGLWVSAEIIQKHGGMVRVRSRTAEQDGPEASRSDVAAAAKLDGGGRRYGGQRSGTVFMVFFPEAGVATVQASVPV